MPIDEWYVRGKIEWHGGKPYGICLDCGKPVQLNKKVFGSLHFCVTVCEKRGHHSGPLLNKSRVGPFWKRRDEFRCVDCYSVVLPPEGYQVWVAE